MTTNSWSDFGGEKGKKNRNFTLTPTRDSAHARNEKLSTVMGLEVAAQIGHTDKR